MSSVYTTVIADLLEAEGAAIEPILKLYRSVDELNMAISKYNKLGFAWLSAPEQSSQRITSMQENTHTHIQNILKRMLKDELTGAIIRIEDAIKKASVC